LISASLSRVSQVFSGRLADLAKRYAAGLPDLLEGLDQLSTRVEMHLKKMGFAWT
jgi:type I restriction enzyme M protein